MMQPWIYPLVILLLSSWAVSATAASEDSKAKRYLPIRRMSRHRTSPCCTLPGPSGPFLRSVVVPWTEFEASSLFTSGSVSSILSIRGGGNVDEFADEGYGWMVDLGSPAALIAGAVIAILYENARGGQLELRKGDTAYVKFAKKMTSILLLSAFALEIIAIFVTTVTGTMMRNTDFSHLKSSSHNALEFMRENFEFEYLTVRISFLQGLLNWLGAVAMEFTIPSATEGRVAPKMDQFVAISLFTLILILISFFNKHLMLYDNYFKMMIRWLYVSTDKFFTVGPMAFLYIPGIFLSLYYGVLAFREDQEYAEDTKTGDNPLLK